VSTRRTVAIMGATGSIGRQTLDVLIREPDQFELVALSAHGRLDDLIAIAKEHRTPIVVVTDETSAFRVRAALGPLVSVLVGEEGLREAASRADIVVNAVVGFAGLPVTLAALESGKRLALANKESLIAAAPLVQRVRAKGEIVPIDSEHCAIHQCLVGRDVSSVRRLLLTASGGPFREMTREELEHVTIEAALAHPTWSMGAKITVDSSTLMNKGLEVIEASALFGIDVRQIDVVVHPQSIVHSMVEFHDSSVIAQLSRPDMRLPIAYALGFPDRIEHEFGQLDWQNAVSLTFEPPRRADFPALDLAVQAAQTGGAAPAWLSAANEVAVDAFLRGRLRWIDIAAVVASTMDRYEADALDSLEALVEADQHARAIATGSLPE
jgi:1-deoxy-D-xylulose-5-phosphate reductoisomerase